MAGRGTDILLGGSPQDPTEAEEVRVAGGLHVLGTERHESRRVDNQLRGRTGRQGDPGSSAFFLALDDELMRLFGTDRLSGLMGKLGMKEGEDIQHPLLSRSIEGAQRKVEAMNFDIRKQLLEYDSVMNKQREMVYSLRNQLLDGQDVSQTINYMLSESVNEHLGQFIPPKALPDLWDTGKLHEWLKHLLEDDGGLDAAGWAKLSRPEIVEKVTELSQQALKRRAETIGAQMFAHLERMILLQMIDVAWKEHLYDLDQLKKGISLRAYAQQDPLIEFQKEAFELFSAMMTRIREQTIEYIFKVQIATPPPLEGPTEAPAPAPTPSPFTPRSVFGGARAEKPEFETPTGGGHVDDQPLMLRNTAPAPNVIAPARKSGPGFGSPKAPASLAPAVPSKIGRNDPCFCGSGKKYKKCHGQ